MTLDQRCRQIEEMARELAGFESLEKMGPLTIQLLGHKIVGLAVDIRREAHNEQAATDPSLRIAPEGYEPGDEEGEFPADLEEWEVRTLKAHGTFPQETFCYGAQHDGELSMFTSRSMTE